MRFEVTQHYAADVDAVLAEYTDAAFCDRLGELPRVGRPELVEHRAAPGRVTTRIRYRFTAELPPGANRVIDAERLTWVEETVYDLAGRSATVRLLPDHYPDRLSANATVQFVAEPRDGHPGTRRHIAGDLRVKAPLVAGRVERAIVGGLEEYLDAEQAVVCHRLGGCA